MLTFENAKLSIMTIIKIRANDTLATTTKKLFLGPRACIPRDQKQRVRISLAVKMENGDLSQLVTL
jgi:hypothetical protein